MDTNIVCIYFRCLTLFVLSGVFPVFAPRQQLTLAMLLEKHTKNACLLCNHSTYEARGDWAQDTLGRTRSLSTMMKEFLRRNGLHDPKLEDGNVLGRLAPFPQVFICPSPSNGHFTPQLEQSDYLANEGGQCHRTKPTGSPETRHSCSLYASQENFMATDSRPKWHPIIRGLVLRPSQSSESQVPSHEDALTREPEPEVAPTQSTEEHLACPATPCSVIIIDNTPVGSPIPSPEIPTSSSPHSHDEAWQELNDL
ncbi:hypothetical protein O181_018334 [Austropuccinia psidii MF-1]|uniref:Uncharacterized protein n=1 Tax=Austropuccinia psidii MF-1 TaxID=1389203 RepID=A0A9Q3C550_9BASI|nr:hypothetical protein [Austropuccinia psidii MF-1]